MRHVPAPCEVVHGVKLQEDDIWHVQAHAFHENVQALLERNRGHTEQVDLRVLSMVLSTLQLIVTYLPRGGRGVYPSEVAHWSWTS